MKSDLTELVFILDRSGSMGGLESDTIGGYNSMLMKQKNESGSANVTTVLFDDNYEILHERVDINKIDKLTNKQYYVRGTTALLDAIGKTLNFMISVQKKANNKPESQNVVFVITTDGMENASKEYSYKKINKMVEHQKEKYGWEFIFLGANIDAINTAERFGIDKENAVNFLADREGIALNFEVISECLSSYRVEKKIKNQWKDRIDADYNSRRKK